jgi:hypothetical protein
MITETERDLKGYGRRRPFADWPGGSRVAVSFVLNYEEGGERSVADGDAHAENYLVPEIVGLPAIREHAKSWGACKFLNAKLRGFGKETALWGSWFGGCNL